MPSRSDPIARRFGAGLVPLRERTLPLLPSVEEHDTFTELLLDAAFLHLARALGFSDACGPPSLSGAVHEPSPSIEGAKEALSAYVDRWVWDPSPEPPEGALGPDILSWIYESSLTRKPLGAYYTASDVSGYIATATLVPLLFDRLARRLAVPVAELVNLPRVSGGEGVLRYLRPAVPWRGKPPEETDGQIEQWREHHALLLQAAAAGEIRTPNDFVSWNLDLRLLALDWIRVEEDPARLEGLLDTLWGVKILDPTCGAGAFLLAALDLLHPLATACLSRLEGLTGRAPWPESPLGRDAAVAVGIAENALHGLDLLDGALRTCRLRLCLFILAHSHRHAPLRPWTQTLSALPTLARNLRQGDALYGWPDTPGRPETRFDAVLGNPPYVAWRRAAPGLEHLHTARCGNLCAPIVEQALAALVPGGRMGVVLPISAVSGPEYRPLMELLQRNDCWISTFSNRPAKLFPCVEQRLAIVLTAPSASPVLRTSPYQHWYEHERPALLERLVYWPASRCERTGMPVKTGTATAESIFQKLTAASGRLEELSGPGDAAVWLHDGPTYWVRALSFQPNEGAETGASSHYHRIPVETAESARVLSAILSSSTFYFYYKAVSNCRDLGQQEWTTFPLARLTAPRRVDLARLGQELEERLRATARLKTRVYPAGAVRYEEYYPAAAVDVLDRIDAVLAEQYEFNPEELEYIRQLDRTYRLGRGG